MVNPHLNHSDIVAEIARRTTVNPLVVNQVLSELVDVIQQSIEQGVEVKIPGIGKFFTIEYLPRKNVTFFDRFTKTMKYYPYTMGFTRPKFIFSDLFVKYIKARTRVTYAEKFGEEVTADMIPAEELQQITPEELAARTQALREENTHEYEEAYDTSAEEQEEQEEEAEEQEEEEEEETIEEEE